MIGAGYSWCATLNKCIRAWETPCPKASTTCPPPDLNPIINALKVNIIPIIQSITNNTKILKIPNSKGKDAVKFFNRYITGTFKQALQEIQQQLPCNISGGGEAPALKSKITPKRAMPSKCGVLSDPLYKSIANSFNEHIYPIIADILENEEESDFNGKKLLLVGYNPTQTIVDYINGPLLDAMSIIQNKLPCPEPNTSNESGENGWFGGRRKTKRLAMKRRKTMRLAMKKSKKSLRRRRS